MAISLPVSRLWQRWNSRILARGFNQTAERIETLMNANKLLLAHASHEIRTPITRIRLQVEMMTMLRKSVWQNDTR